LKRPGGYCYGTLAEDIEERDGLYQSIRRPGKRPRFPIRQLIPRAGKISERAKEAVLVHHTEDQSSFA